jgi:hypothetical protein
MSGIWGRRRRLVKVLCVYLGSVMNEMFPAPSLPSMCLVCNVGERQVTEGEITFDCSKLCCGAVVVTARSELIKYKMILEYLIYIPFSFIS